MILKQFYDSETLLTKNLSQNTPTFAHPNGKDSSHIDYIFAQYSNTKLLNTEIIEWDDLNVSDHTL